MSVTPAIRFLKQHKVPHEVLEYDHKVKGASFAAEAIGWPLEAVLKTLVVALNNREFALCCLPGTAELSLKNLARAAGVKSARMATQQEATKVTGYVFGGTSPFGTRKRLPVWFHEPVVSLDRIAINGGHPGTLVALSPQDAVSVLGAQTADLAA